MRISNKYQYNQSIGKYKLLSSTSGVGSIITTNFGSYALILDINKWNFLNTINKRISNIRRDTNDEFDRNKSIKSEFKNKGLDYIDDLRFVKFIKLEKEVDNLMCLVGIPHMSLSETFNKPNWDNHPIRNALRNAGEADDSTKYAYNNYMINASLFPKWFKNKKGELKKLNEWKTIWGKNNDYRFAPPRDANDPIGTYKNKGVNDTIEEFPNYRVLEQTNIILICPNGHLSDIPWEKYLKWKTGKIRNLIDDSGENLLSGAPCCDNPKLKWTESKTKSDGYGSVFIHCESCGCGNGGEHRDNFKDFPKVSLEGINSIKPYCIGEKPWEIFNYNNQLIIPKETCFVNGQGIKESMRVALVTANNVYYANGFSSLFIPMHIAEDISQKLSDALNILNKRYEVSNNRKAISKEDFWMSRLEDTDRFQEFVTDNDIKSYEDDFKEDLKEKFINLQNEENYDFHEDYRWQEYRCFSNNDELDENGLRFKDILLQKEFNGLLQKIQQVRELKVTNVQLDFTRVNPKERIIVNGEVRNISKGQNIFSCDVKELFVLPVNQVLGEGLFFEFSNKGIDDWIENNKNSLNERYQQYIENEPDMSSQGLSSKLKLFNNKYKHFLIHSFSHIIMRELEFSCGYPTASLKERLYISNSEEKLMSGVLIYTAEGSEGSMGGLVTQGEPEKILEVIRKALERSINCSSDPLCWESEGQGIFDLNLSACFSCSLVAETACEELNLGLDRRALVDMEFGYFKDLI